MDITSAKYNETGDQILAIIKGRSTSIPVDTDNRHYRAILEWEAAGNTIEAYVAPPVEEPQETTEEKMARLEARLAALEGK